MMFYHSFDNKPFKAIIVSGILAAMNNFSELEIQERGIQSMEMHDLRWTYLKSDEHNLLLIAADTNSSSNTKVMKARLEIVLDIFVKKYHIDLKYWDEDVLNIEVFEGFKNTLNSLKREWEIASESMDLGNILDLLFVFQQILIKLIKIIKTKVKKKIFPHILEDLYDFSPQLKEFYHQACNPDPKSFDILQYFIPKINLEEHKIYFDATKGKSLIGKESIGLEPNYLKGFFFMIIRYYSETVKDYLDDIIWHDIFCTEFLPFFVSKYKYLKKLRVFHKLMKYLFITEKN